MSWIGRIFGWDQPRQPKQQPGVGTPRAKRDAARTTAENAEHWRLAGPQGPLSATPPADRATIRYRVRHEVENNCTAAGVVSLRVNDLIGTGPRLAITLPDPDTATLTGVTSNDRVEEMQAKAEERERAARVVEEQWSKWAKATRLAATLRTMVRAEMIDGEVFALNTTDPSVRHPVKLRLRPFECDRVAAPWTMTSASTDGIEFDAAGNPTRYRVLRQHPGDAPGVAAGGGEADWIPASQVYHLFRADRPGQVRGVSWLSPCLGLFADNRRYLEATVAAAETAATIGAYITQPAETGVLPDGDDDEEDEIEAMDTIPLPRRASITLPPGANMAQLKAEHPTSVFEPFRRELAAEVGRALDMPVNLVTRDSSKHNFASGRLDIQPYVRQLGVEREDLSEEHLLRLFAAWLVEATKAGIIPPGLPPADEWTIEFYWDAVAEFVDPTKESAAIEKLLQLNLTTLAEQAGLRGLRWRDLLKQRAVEQAELVRLGLLPASPTPTPAVPPARTDDEPNDTELEDVGDTEVEDEDEEVPADAT